MPNSTRFFAAGARFSILFWANPVESGDFSVAMHFAGLPTKILNDKGRYHAEIAILTWHAASEPGFADNRRWHKTEPQ
jgi:hypothetical protein